VADRTARAGSQNQSPTSARTMAQRSGRLRAISFELCRKMGLLTKASVAIDGSKFKAVEQSRTTNFTEGQDPAPPEADRRERWRANMSQLDTADRQTAEGEEPSETVLLNQDAA